MKQFVRRFLFLFFKIVLGCLLGCIVVLFYASYSQGIRQEIKKIIQQKFKNEFDCDWDGQVHSIDLLTLNIEFRNVSFLPCNRSDGWSMYTDKFYMSASIFDFIFYRKFNCHSYFEQVVVYEKQISNSSHFAQVIAKMFQGTLPSNLSFNYITIDQGLVILEDCAGDGTITYRYNCQMSYERDGLHTKLYILDGSVLYKNKIVCEKIFGNFASIVPYNNDLKDIYARVDCRLSIPALQEKGSCFCVGDLYRGRGAFVISNEDQSFIIEPLKIALKHHSMPIHCSVTMQSDLLQLVLADQIFDKDLTGCVTLSLKGNCLNLIHGLEGKLHIHNLAYKNNNLLNHGMITIEKNDAGYMTNVFVNNESWFEGTLTHQDDNFYFNIHNIVPLQLWWNHYWNIPSQSGNISGFIDTNLYEVRGNYFAPLESMKLQDKADVEGSFVLNLEKFSCSGSFIDKNYVCILDWLPVPHLVELRYFSDNESFIDIHEHEDAFQGTVGTVGFNFIKNWLPDSYKLSFSQPGKFDIAGNFKSGCYHAQLSTQQAHIRIPSLYNVVQDFSAQSTLDFMARSIFIDAMIAHLYEGTVHCDRAVAMFDNQAQPSFLHIPLFLDNVLMSWSKGIFGIVSGRLFLSQKLNQIPLLQGNLMVDKAQIKGNIFSKEFQDQLVGAVGSTPGVDMHCNLDVSIQTKAPIMVETSFLQAMVHFDLHLVNTVKQPEFEGSIDIASGELKFPYKSLFITHGQIVMMPKQSIDPTIEFVAKGKIKRYNITMRATGTVVDQHIHFESSPYLTEEQIISLLLIGSHDSSLSAVMPAMFMQKLHEIVFGPAISKSKLDVIFNRLLQSFKNIRIFPQFTNQTGRGGVRGVVEIDATDRLHGRIDSNLMQLEDTIFEADYLLTDDVTVRAIKDGPSTYGGEVEMRWKFS